MLRRLIAALAVLLLSIVSLPAGAVGACGERAGVCPSVQPGSRLSFSRGFCTAGFLYRDALGRRWLTTAGHCGLSDDEFSETVWESGMGPAVFVDGKLVGEFRYAVVDAVGDLGLILLKDGVEAVSEVAIWGGPTGVLHEAVRSPMWLRHYGHGWFTTELGVNARKALATSIWYPRFTYMTGYSAWGDSGSPVIAPDGRAVGLIAGGTAGVLVTEVGPRTPDQLPPSMGDIVVYRMGPMMARAEATLGLRLILMTAPLRAGS